MRFLPTRIHGIIDYVVGVLLIAGPFILDWNPNAAESLVPIALGAAAILYSAITRYEAGIFKVLRMPVHLTLDFASGVLFALSPWIFGFAETVWIPHVVAGLFEIMASLITRKETSDLQM